MDSDELRDRLLEQALRAGLSVRELARQIEEEHNEGSDNATRTSIRDALVSLTAQADRLSAQVSGELAEVVDLRELSVLHAKDVDALLARAIRAHAGLCDRAQVRLQELERVRDRITTDRTSRARGALRVGGAPRSMVAGAALRT